MRRGGGAGGERRTLQGLSGTELVSDSCCRQGESARGASDAGNSSREDAMRSIGGIGHMPGAGARRVEESSATRTRAQQELSEVRLG
jgi:hypothetical protein